MEWNWLLIVAFLLRLADNVLNRDVPFTWHKKDGINTVVNIEGQKNIKTTVFNALLIILAFYLSFYIYPEGTYKAWQYMIGYFVVGWFIDSFLKTVLTWGGKAVDGILGSKRP